MCPGCDVTNRGRFAACENCGSPRPSQDRALALNTGPAICPHDGKPLMANGWCEYGQGYPMMRACPHVCDRCRRPLTWGGTCLSCDRYAPGDRYEYDATNPHWRMVEKGPFEILPREEQARMARDFEAMVARLVARSLLNSVGRKGRHELGSP